MEENKQPKDKKEQTEKEPSLKTGFLKKVWYSITKIEKYPEMAAQGAGKAMSYLMKIVACIALVLCFGLIYQTHNLVKDGTKYLQDEFPEFTYKEGILDVNSDQTIVINDSPIVGKIIVDTKTDNEEQINQYVKQIGVEENGIVVLKDKVLLKNVSVSGTISYNYRDILDSFQIKEFVKQDVLNYCNSGKIFTLYLSIFLTIFIYAFAIYFLTTLSNVIFLSAFGYITTYLARIKMRYVAVFNMSVYAITLSVILNILYIAVNIFTTFEVKYFQVMYVAVAAIYLVAAILILKTDFMKKQMELMKIVETQKIIREQMEKQEEKDKTDKKDNEEKQEKKEKKNKKQEEKDNSGGQEPEGSNA